MSTYPGDSAFTRTPREAHSKASDLVIATSPALEALYATCCCGTLTMCAPDIEAMVTIRPDCCSSITRPTRWQVRKTPVRLTPMVRCQTARIISSAGVGSSDSPAAATSPSIRPAPRSTCCTAASIESSDSTSTSTNVPAPDSGRRRSSANTSRPASASQVATAWPTPPAAPVTTTAAPSTQAAIRPPPGRSQTLA